ncbi:MAG: hypothetical protein ACI9OU_000681 [Candidatus Promineifilaceae bacterium]|jgi:hypothetical protein
MRAHEKRRSGLLLGTSVVFLSAALLFTLELAVAKALLPRFGGSPMVWTASMLVYQVLLLGGYAYAHGLADRCSGPTQVRIHVGLLIVAVGVSILGLRVPSLAGGDPAAMSRHPLAGLLFTMLTFVAIPFIAVSATSPLVQHWQQRLYPGQSVYRLYAVSNAGSFVGLLAYPFLVEPRLSLEQQLTIWTALFAITAAALTFVAWRVMRHSREADTPQDIATATESDIGPERRGRDRLLWIILPASTSALLLSATNELCQDLAVFPFMWVLPLSLYLLSFTLTFRDRSIRNAFAFAALATVAGLVTAALSLHVPAPVHIVTINLLVLACCLAAHRELYRVRPPARQLTSYYLRLAAGSGIGAALVTLVAPTFFGGFWEFQISVLAVWIALVLATAWDRSGCMHTGDKRQAATLLGLGVFLLLNAIPEAWMQRHIPAWPAQHAPLSRIGLPIFLAAVLWVAVFRRRPGARSKIWPRVLAGLVLFIVECSLLDRVRSDLSVSGIVGRNFFGVIRVVDNLHKDSGIQVRQLSHGRINHGWQYVNPELRPLPTAYHSPSTGIGQLLIALQDKHASIRIGVTGLGAGALAAYPRSEDLIVFYEIDPQVIALSQGDTATFSFLSDCPGETAVVLGDARQSLQLEHATSGSREFDVLALDAFSSDAIPVHLLTHEAIALYLQHLKQPSGVLAINISNRFLDIEPVVNDAALAFGLKAVLVDSPGDAPVRARSLWALLSHDPRMLDLKAPEGGTIRPLITARVAWTDTYGSPFQLIKWWTPQSRHVRVSELWRNDRPSEPATAELLPEQTPAVPAE